MTRKRAFDATASAHMRKSLVWTLPVGAACIVLGTILRGSEGAAGAALGVAVVYLFFISSPLLLGPIATVSPQLSIVVALSFFATKAIALVALAVVLARPSGIGDHVDQRALGLTLIACTITLTAMALIVAKRSRQPLYDLDSE